MFNVQPRFNHCSGKKDPQLQVLREPTQLVLRGLDPDFIDRSSRSRSHSIFYVSLTHFFYPSKICTRSSAVPFVHPKLRSTAVSLRNYRHWTCTNDAVMSF